MNLKSLARPDWAHLDWRELVRALQGPPRDPLDPNTRHRIALVAFLAWIGLGADGLSSSCYGPEEAFEALGTHVHLSLYLAIATAATVFIIAVAYNQVIELFPSGGGGYKVATKLIGPHAGLLSGSALIVDYVLTIAISVASGVDALFSLLPVGLHVLKIEAEAVLLLFLLFLNLRGMKESVRVLMPIFLGFVITHAGLIVWGIAAHADRFPVLIADTVTETTALSAQFGWLFVASLFLRAYSLGGGTYTGIEAVSNNINTLAEPRVKTGKWTMFYMATSLAFTAGGIILLYLLWDARPVEGKTLNAVAFGNVLGSWQAGGVDWDGLLLPVVLALEAGLLFVAANTGFLGGPAVLANMANDAWVPRQFGHLSGRLVTKNGVVLFGLAALAILVWSGGDVSLLVVLYSINVFLTFSLSLAGLTRYWLRNRGVEPQWWWRLPLSALGLVVTGGILLVTIYEKFTVGGWVTLVITGLVVTTGLAVRRHYDAVRARLKAVDELFPLPEPTAETAGGEAAVPPLDPKAPTAAFLISRSRGSGMHTFLWAQRLFPGQFRNFVFLSVGEVDAQAYARESSLETMQEEVGRNLEYFVRFCQSQGLAATSYAAYATDLPSELLKLARRVTQDFPNTVFFSSMLVFEHDNWVTRLLHNHTPLTMQRLLHLDGLQMVILPMRVR